MIRILFFILFISCISSAYAGFTAPTNGISTSGSYTVSWQGNPMDYGVSAYDNYGTPLYKLTEQKLNSGVAPTPITLPNWTSSSVSFSAKAAGQYVYTYSERRCTVSGCTYFTPPDGQMIVAVGSDARVFVEPVEPTTSVGNTVYSAGVSNKGEAIISIPIYTPEGIGGMQPSLSLNFGSSAVSEKLFQQSPSGWLGFGWGLSGISTINRCTVGTTDWDVPVDVGNPSLGTIKARPKLKYDNTDSLF